jgi:tRNA(His) 5'-end guanylyltransferase
MKDALGDRMKDFYEDRTRIKLPRRTYTIIRIDGKAFHTYTKGMERPFDEGLIQDMDETTAYLCKNIQGVKFGYVQSDEISLLLTDFDDLTTDMWFDGNLQKMASIAASLATAKFNELRTMRMIKEKCNKTDWSKVTNETLMMNLTTCFKLAMFDARVFQIPYQEEVLNYFIWRQQDATRNSISSVAQSLYSPKELHSVKTDQMQEMIFQKGINWNDYSPRKKRGGFISKVLMVNGKPKQENQEIFIEDVVRSKWLALDCPVFTQDREFLTSRIPSHND